MTHHQHHSYAAMHEQVYLSLNSNIYVSVQELWLVMLLVWNHMLASKLCMPSKVALLEMASTDCKEGQHTPSESA